MRAAYDSAGDAAHIDRLLATRPLGGDVELGDFLTEITDGMLAAARPLNGAMLTHSHLKGRLITAAQAPPVGRIVGELVANAISYAHPAGVWGRIDIRSWAHKASGGVSIEVSDDGVGLPESFDPLVDGGLGLDIVRTLAGQLGAGLRFIDTGVGLSVCLDMPGLN